MRKTILAAAISFFMVFSLLPAIALAEEEGGYAYTVSDEKATITGYTGSDTNISIPVQLGGYAVTQLGDESFQDKTTLKSITLPDGITNVGSHAFSNCSQLSKLYFFGEQPAFGEEAFSGVSSDFKVYYPISKSENWSTYTASSKQAFCSLTLKMLDGSDDIISKANVDGGSIPDPEEPERDGYTFGGWYLDEGCNTQWTNENIQSDVILYAKWVPQATTVTVTFNSMGGSEVDVATAESGSTITKPSKPINPGFSFGGWYREEACSTEWAFDTDTVTENITLYAKWTSNGTPFTGSGTEEDPYGISTPEQLNAVRDHLDGHFILLNDIDLYAATAPGGEFYNSGKGWTPIGDNLTPFTGFFNGGGFVIKNMHISNPAILYIGLFGRNSGTITRLGTQNCEITANDAGDAEIFIGSIAGSNYGTIRECYNTGHILVSSYFAKVGGIAGGYGTIEKCFNTGTISANGYYAYVGGIAGFAGTIKECYNTGSITFGSEETLDTFGAIAGSGSTKVSNCYFSNFGFRGVAENYGGSQTFRKSALEMTRMSTFTAFDFENTWIMSSDTDFPCPILKGVHFFAGNENTSEFSGGVGTIYNPYKVGTPDQLNNVRHYLGAHFVMTNNIDLLDATSEGGEYYNDGAGWIPIGGDYQDAFCGSFDGGGHTINGLRCVYATTETNSALFARNDGEITNLGLNNIYIQTRGRAAGVAAKNSGIISHCFVGGEISGEYECGGISAASDGKITSCYNTSTVTAQNVSSSIGGIVGYMRDNGEAGYCYNTGNIRNLMNSGLDSAGGIAGTGLYSDNTAIHDCFNMGAVSVAYDQDSAGGIAGEYIDDIKHCYNIGSVSGSDCSAAIVYSAPSTITDTYFLDTGEPGLIGATDGYDRELSNKKTHIEMTQRTTFTAFDFDNIWEMPVTGCYLYPVLKGLPHDPLQGETQKFDGGLGTIASPFIIATPEHLNNVRLYDHKYFILANDIDMSSATSEGGAYYNNGAGWEPIGFSSSLNIHFDGGGHSISGLKINRPEQSNIGLFGRITSSSIKNLKMLDVDVTSAYICGGIAGSCSGEIKNCSVSGSITGTKTQTNYGVGGIAGIMYSGDISFCTNTAKISSYVKAGGIVGDTEGNISYCSNHGAITGLGTTVIGGIAGETHGRIRDCYNTADLFQTNPDEDSGGIAGWHYYSGYTYTNCYNIGHATYGITACNWTNITLWSHCYYLEGMCEKEGNYGDPKSATALQSQSSYEGYDFANVWTMAGETTYPFAELQNIIQPTVKVQGTLDLSDFGDNSTITVGTVETGSNVILTNNTGATFNNVRIVCLAGTTITLNNVKIYNRAGSPYCCALSFSGTGNELIVQGECSLQSGSDSPGIKVQAGTSLEIQGTGTLDVSGCSGIGAYGNYSAGNITIHSGTIIALGRWDGAGIGGGENGSGGTITITGGIVSARSNADGAGIGGGDGGDGGIINIEGGQVTAQGSWAAGIGGGYGGDGGSITISGGTVNAIGSMYSAGIGGGYGGNGGTIVINDGTIYAARGTDAPCDIGYGNFRGTGSLEISGNAIVFLKNGVCVTPINNTHTLLSTQTIVNHKAFGLEIPYPWTTPVYAYLNNDDVFTARYNINGGTGNNPESITQYKNTKTIIQSGDKLTKNRLHFLYWNTLPDGTGERYNAGDEYTFTANITLYAIYEKPISVSSVTISGNNEPILCGTYRALWATVVPSNATYPEITWSSSDKSVATVDQNGIVEAIQTGKAFISAAVDGITGSCEVTVYRYFTVQFDSRSGSIYDDQFVKPNSTITKPSDPYKEGHSFEGWYRDNAYRSKWNFEKDPVSTDMILYAKWTVNSYSVNFNTQNGGKIDSKITNYNTTITKPVIDPQKQEFTFAGWYKEKECVNIWNFNTDKVTCDTTLYAKWQPVSAYLSGLKLTQGASITPAFYKAKYSYKVLLNENTGRVTLTPTKENKTATMTLNGAGGSSLTVELKNGQTVTRKIRVYCASTTRTYTFTITREKSSNNYLSGLTAKGAGITPVFSKYQTEYRVELPEGTDKTTIYATAERADVAKVYYSVRSYTLKNGETRNITIKVRSQKGVYRYYHVTIHRAKSTNTNLASLYTNSSRCRLSAPFNANITDYTMTMPANQSSVSIYSKAADRLSKVSAKVTINGVTRATNRVSLAKGQSAVVEITVTAQSKDTKVYRITITRATV